MCSHRQLWSWIQRTEGEASASHNHQFLVILSGVICGGLRDFLGDKSNVFHSHRRADLAGNTDPSAGSWKRPLQLEHVVLSGPRRYLPALTAVGRHLHFFGPTISIFHSGGEPILGCAIMHVNAQRVGFGNWTFNEFPFDAVDAAAGIAVCELGPSIWSHVEMVLISACKIRDLHRVSNLFHRAYDLDEVTNHHGNFLPFVRDRDAASAVGSVVPDLF